MGIYAYRKSFLKKYASWKPAPLEKTERLEQLRALHYGARIHVEIACEDVPGSIDTKEDLFAVRALFPWYVDISLLKVNSERLMHT